MGSEFDGKFRLEPDYLVCIRRIRQPPLLNSKTLPSFRIMQECWWKRLFQSESIPRSKCHAFFQTLFHLQDVKPDIPEYEAIRIRMRAYDFVPLESFARYAYKLVDRMGVDSEM